MRSPSQPPRPPGRALHLVLAAVLATSVLGGFPGRAAAAPPPAQQASARPYTVTLVTGDRVEVRPRTGGKPVVRVKRGPGRQAVRFVGQPTRSGGLRVIPTDALRLIRDDRLDPRLFDVVLLRRLHYDDAHRRTLPLILTGRAGAAPQAFGTASEQRRLPRIGATILTQEKGSTRSFWSSVTADASASDASPRMASAGARKIWLSSAYRVRLDRSVPQIGGPVAWRAGYTGRGVKVAVLDTGIDTTHPDFAGAVAASRDFSGSPAGVRDTVGHGTHVASIIAGRGTASAGKYTGAAKGASLLIGKVCTDIICTEDAILAGMEWAAEQQATVANLSLGGPVGDGADPVEDAVQILTASADTLFVVAAGNTGPGAETVESPANAGSALAVGSVNRADVVSDFSSRGPRVNASRRLDYAVKPDLTAPGEAIVAASAQGIEPLGEPVNRFYQALSGTSMATPHVSAAAAILAQQHPDLTAGQLKAALMSTAVPTSGATVYDQGAGRVDIGRAVSQRVFGDKGSLSLGYFPWPHRAERPSTQVMTYRNTGSGPVRLALSATFTDAAGHAAPRGVLRLGSPSVTVPAHGTASVPVTIDPTRAAVGLYSGRVVARSGSTVVTTALGAYSEPESYNVDVTTIGSNGQAPLDAYVTITDPATGLLRDLDMRGGTGSIRLRPGTYTFFSVLDSADDIAADVRTVTVRNRDTDLLVDARQGNAVSVSAAGRSDAVPDLAALIMAFTSERSGFFWFVFAEPERLRLVPTPTPVRGFGWTLAAALHQRGTGEPDNPTPYVYNGLWYGSGRLPARPAYRFTRSNTATVTHHIARQDSTAGEPYFGALGRAPDGGGGGGGFPLGSLTRRTDHYNTDGGVTWSRVLEQYTAQTDEFVSPATQEGTPVRYRPGRRGTERWNTAVLGPSWGYSATGRVGDAIAVDVAVLSDPQPGHVGYATAPYDQGSTTLYRGSQVVASEGLAGRLLAADLPAGEQGYRLVVDNRRTADFTRLTTRTTAEWTFRSGHADEEHGVTLPLSVVRFRPGLDDLSRAPRSGTLAIPVVVERQPGATPANVSSLRVEASFDDGATWVDVPLTRSGSGWTATVTHPGRSGFVSLRATAGAADGTTVKETVIRAYALK